MKTLEEARRDLLGVLPLIKLDIAEAEIAGGTVELGIIVKEPNGYGRVAATFGKEFLADVAALIGVADDPGWMREDQKADRQVAITVAERAYRVAVVTYLMACIDQNESARIVANRSVVAATASLRALGVEP